MRSCSQSAFGPRRNASFDLVPGAGKFMGDHVFIIIDLFGLVLTAVVLGLQSHRDRRRRTADIDGRDLASTVKPLSMPQERL
jgi:hypothetical protein